MLPSGRTGRGATGWAVAVFAFLFLGERPSGTNWLGIGLIAFSFTSALWLALPCLMVAGFGFMVQMASSNTVIQTIVDDDKRGRVMSFLMASGMPICSKLRKPLGMRRSTRPMLPRCLKTATRKR